MSTFTQVLQAFFHEIHSDNSLILIRTNSLIHSWRFCRKTRFEASRVAFWSLSCYKELKLTTNRFTGRTLRGLLIQVQNISLRSSSMRRKQNPPLFFRFSCLIFFFFSLAGHFVGFVLVGRVFRKAFRILGLDERKGR